VGCWRLLIGPVGMGPTRVHVIGLAWAMWSTSPALKAATRTTCALLPTALAMRVEKNRAKQSRAGQQDDTALARAAMIGGGGARMASSRRWEKSGTGRGWCNSTDNSADDSHPGPSRSRRHGVSVWFHAAVASAWRNNRRRRAARGHETNRGRPRLARCLVPSNQRFPTAWRASPVCVRSAGRAGGPERARGRSRRRAEAGEKRGRERERERERERCDSTFLGRWMQQGCWQRPAAGSLQPSIRNGLGHAVGTTWHTG